MEKNTDKVQKGNSQTNEKHTVPFFEPHHHIFPVHSAVYDYDNTPIPH